LRPCGRDKSRPYMKNTFLTATWQNGRGKCGISVAHQKF
jgi:hypothetical protein